MDSTFRFLEEFESLYKKALEFEKTIKKDTKLSVIAGRNFLDEIIKFLLVKNELADYLECSNNKRLKILEEKGMLQEEILKYIDVFNTIVISCEVSNDIEVESIKLIHEILFTITIKIKEDYSSEAFNYQTYNKGESISDFYEKVNNNIFEKNEDKTLSVKEETEDAPMLYGSSLLYQLAKLSDFSKEVIQNANELDDFKNYLHVERPIQIDLQNKLAEVANKEESHLILLCGSVGDGKSHLLAYMNEKNPDIMSEFIIHNDATESFDPHKNSVDTLIDVLMPFCDENIKKSSEKIIVAINVGVLNNFLEAEFTKENFKELHKFINEAKIFDEKTLSRNVSKGSFHLISFSDYQMFELTEEGVFSSYISGIFNKIVLKSDENPFYKAYLKDLSNKKNSPIVYNYEFFQNEEVRGFIVDLLIKSILQYKAIFSTRALFNFIFDILVPSNVEDKINSKTIIEVTENFLPNLLFESKDKSNLLKIINKVDPVNIRTSEIDLMLIDLANSKDVKSFFKSNFEADIVDKWVDNLENLGAFNELTEIVKILFNKTLIRLKKIISMEEKTDEEVIYRDYIKYLYYYNSSRPRELKNLYLEVKKGLFSWRGGPIQNDSKLYINDCLDEMRIAQALSIKANTSNLDLTEDYRSDRFKKSIVIAFKESNSNEVVSLEIDYSLYLILIRVLRGRRPSKKDKEEALKFIEFLDKLIKLSNRENETFIYDLQDRVTFKLELDEIFGEFNFERV